MTISAACRALYVHVPYCRRRCGYCDFYSQVADESMPAMVDALLAELRMYCRRQVPQLETLYVGGGTPTVLPPTELRRLLEVIGTYRAGDAAEFTVEANPATVTPEVAAVLVQAGVNRISIGAQSFVADELRTLERLHGPDDIAATVHLCRAHGLRHVSLDLIFGIPGQTLDSWRSSLEAAVELAPEHISCYALTYEEGTPFQKRRQTGQLNPVDPDVEADMYELTLDLLPAAGYAQYEISNFARAGAECRHNLRYWHNLPYLGVGPSAAGFVDGVRYKNVADTVLYLSAVKAGRLPQVEQERLPPDRRARETAMLMLRLSAGIGRWDFQHRFGVDPLEFFAEAISRHKANGLVEVSSDSVRLTRAGRMLADQVIADFL